MILITLNGEHQDLPVQKQLSEVLSDFGYVGNHFAVALDGAFVPRSQYDSVTLKGGEAIEVLTPKQGG